MRAEMAQARSIHLGPQTWYHTARGSEAAASATSPRDRYWTRLQSRTRNGRQG